MIFGSHAEANPASLKKTRRESTVPEVSPRPGVTKARPDSPKPGPIGFPTVPSWEYSAGVSGIVSVSFSPTSQDVAVAQTNRFVQIISSRTGRLSYSVPFVDPNAAVTVPKRHPQNDQPLILTCGTSGYIGLCQYFRGEYVWRAQELDTHIFAGDFSMYGSHFASADKAPLSEFTTGSASSSANFFKGKRCSFVPGSLGGLCSR
jgi:hypothetical protein